VDGVGSDILSQTNSGANTVFQLNGLNVTKSSAVVSDVVSGVSFTFNGTTTADPTQTVGISLASDNSKISAALQDVVAKYNVVSGQLNAQIGPAAGLLNGNPIINQTRQALFSLVNSSASNGSVQSLADLGIELNSSGVMSFNSATFAALSSSQITDAYTFLGSATDGPIAMQSQFTQLSDPATGAIKVQEDQYDAADTRITAQVSDLTDRINAMQATLQSKLQVADTLLASLASQQSILTASIQSLNFSSFGFQTQAPTQTSSG
jgi:flagellar hook-associated protein 2